MRTLLVLLVAFVAGCNSQTSPTTAAPTKAVDPVQQLRSQWAEGRDKLLANARQEIGAGRHGAAVVILRPYRDVVDPDLQTTLHEAEVGSARAEAAGLKEPQLTERRRVYAELAKLLPDDAEVARQLSRVSEQLDGVSSLKDAQLCKKMKADILDQAYITEYLSRGGLTSDFRYIALGQIQIGVSELGLKCAWRAPDDVNTTVFNDYSGKQQVHRQYVYGNQYVYTENGVITSLQL